MTESAGSKRSAFTSSARAYRRKLPFGRAAVLVVEGRSHVVGLADVSATGAFLVTRACVSIGAQHLLKLEAIPGGVELRLPARVVRIAQAGEESPHHPRGVAVQFAGLDEHTREVLDAFVHRAARRH